MGRTLRIGICRIAQTPVEYQTCELKILGCRDLDVVVGTIENSNQAANRLDHRGIVGHIFVRSLVRRFQHVKPENLRSLDSP